MPVHHRRAQWPSQIFLGNSRPIIRFFVVCCVSQRIAKCGITGFRVISLRCARSETRRIEPLPVRGGSCIPDCSPPSRVESPIRCRPIGRHGSASVVLRDKLVGDRLLEDIPTVTRGDLAEGQPCTTFSRCKWVLNHCNFMILDSDVTFALSPCLDCAIMDYWVDDITPKRIDIDGNLSRELSDKQIHDVFAKQFWITLVIMCERGISFSRQVLFLYIIYDISELSRFSFIFRNFFYQFEFAFPLIIMLKYL